MFGLYVHIPYCLQICTYCDFVKFERKDLPPNSEYISLLQRELEARVDAVASGTSRILSSIYFGGGTPSLFAPTEILSILESVANRGLRLSPDAEVTLEINPGTIDADSLKAFLEIGVNRFSVGAQTFDESLLRVTGRKHSVQETVETLELLANADVNYSFDLLFGLPGQRLDGVRSDVARAMSFKPSHLSAYNLTVPAKHTLNHGRASDEEQAQMFEAIEEDLEKHGVLRYEVSNFAKPGRESQHNLLYWSDAPYWGLGIGAHSYKPDASRWGTRFWNPATVAAYRKELELASGTDFLSKMPADRVENLLVNEALTDYTHTALRSQRGLRRDALNQKFGDAVLKRVSERLLPSIEGGLVVDHGTHWTLSRKGQALADRVFEAVTFLPADLTF